MNKSRRRALNALQDRISALGLSAMFDSVKEIADELETLRDEEQDALDNLPESLQDGERGQSMRECVDYCDTALESLRAFEDIENNAEEAFAAIEDAKGAA
jgi:hypothetical protein